jgi:hypothetical protein
MRPAARLRSMVPLAVPLALLAACTSGNGGDDPAARSSSAPPPSLSTSGPGKGLDAADGDLQVELDRGNGGPIERYRLLCDGAGAGTLPDADAACSRLAGLTDPFAPLPADVFCSQIFGGPQTAHVTGRWQGSSVDLRLSRTDGCRTAQWDRLGPLLPGPAAEAPPT